jgi:hypothetical protein
MAGRSTVRGKKRGNKAPPWAESIRALAPLGETPAKEDTPDGAK